MASLCFHLQCSNFRPHAICFLHPCNIFTSSISVPSFQRNLSFLATKVAQGSGLKNLLKSSDEGIPNEPNEESKFVPLSADDPKYGPPALLLMGFEKEEMAKIQQLLRELDGEFLKVIFCTEDMVNLSLWEAVNTQQVNLADAKIAISLPRVCVMSGLTGEEMMMFIDAFPEAGLSPAVFAALVPNSANKLISEVVEEIMGDHEMMSSKQSGPP